MRRQEGVRVGSGADDAAAIGGTCDLQRDLLYRLSINSSIRSVKFAKFLL